MKTKKLLEAKKLHQMRSNSETIMALLIEIEPLIEDKQIYSACMESYFLAAEMSEYFKKLLEKVEK